MQLWMSRCVLRRCCCQEAVLVLTNHRLCRCAGAQVNVTLRYSFNRAGPAGAETITGAAPRQLSSEECITMRNALRAALADPIVNETHSSIGEPMVLDKFYPYVIPRWLLVVQFMG